jgi:lipoic acid synthetase
MTGLVEIEPRPTGRLPEFLRKGRTHFPSVQALKNGLRERGLHTVCESARCPNLHECFHRGTATFMILGNLCTRGCSFCSVPKSAHPGPLDPAEPEQAARMAQRMKLDYVVITSVNRDDLPDGGSAHFAATVRAVRAALPAARVEVLIPDFCGSLEAVARVLESGPDVFNHNMETVRRLYRAVRPQADYGRSLQVLAFARRHSPAILTKSGLMAGLGESEAEVNELLRDLRGVDTNITTIGQYLRPARRNRAVAEYVPPDRYERWRAYGESIGFRRVFAGPFVRSSYRADEVSGQASCGSGN